MAEKIPILFGTEMEWPVDAEWTSVPVPGSPLVGRTSYDDLPEGLKRCGTYLSNGMRLYNDHNFIEVSGPEVDNLDELVISEIKGERITQAIMEAAQAAGRVEWFKIQRRVIDGPQNTWGYHENYLALRRLIGAMNGQQLGFLITHLALRNLVVGAGAFVDGEFRLAQKSSRVYADIDETTTVVQHKPLLNTRDKPYASNEYRRLHITSGDPNISPFATRLKVGSTALAVRMVQHGERAERLQLTPETGHQLARQIATDVTLKESFKLASGETMRPIDMLGLLVTRMEVFISQHEVTAGEVWAVKNLRHIHELFTTSPRELQNYLDWPLRKALIERELAKAGIGKGITLEDKEQLRDPKIASAVKEVAEECDLNYDFVASSTHKDSLTKTLRNKLWKAYMPPAERINDLPTPPPGRPTVRGNYIKNKKVSNASWEVIRYREFGKDHEVKMPNPFTGDTARPQ